MDYMTVEEAAEKLGRKPSTLYDAIRDGRLAGTKVLGRVAVTPAALEAYRARTQSEEGKTVGRPKGSRDRKRGTER